MLPLRNFKDYILQNALFNPDNSILLAVSGGKDSVLMAHLFKLSGYNFGIAHCNFNLRGEESQRDEHFVKMLAATLDVPVYVKHFDTKEYAKKHKVSIQMSARDLRYQWFEELRVAENYDFIALGQHQDDAIETVLLNLTKGTGIAGLHGILPKRGFLIRPLLFLSRSSINQIIEGEHIDFVEDSSNLSAGYARNKLRLKVVPQLKEINPNLENTFRQNIQRFSETELVLQTVVSELRSEMLIERQDGICLSIEKVKNLVPQRLLLSELLKPYGFQEPVVADVLRSLDKQSGVSFFSNSHQLILDRTELILTAIDEQLRSRQMIHVDDRELTMADQQLLISVSNVNTFHKDYQFERNVNKAYVDTDQLIFPLILRIWQNGDRFRPIGMKGFKKLSDFFIDEKVPLTSKDHIPLLINGNGEIIWILGRRQDDRYKIIPSTKNVTIFEWNDLHITISKQS